MSDKLEPTTVCVATRELVKIPGKAVLLEAQVRDLYFWNVTKLPALRQHGLLMEPDYCVKKYSQTEL